MQKYALIQLFATVYIGFGCSVSTLPKSNAIPDSGTGFDADNIPADQGANLQEVCNGLDDDTDGLVDEGFRLGATCNLSIERCQLEGVLVCGNNGLAECRTNTTVPMSERCNNSDDDCDGLIDEDFEVGVPCTTAIGQCAVQGRSVCTDDGLHVVCDAETRPPETESCNELDDDCDGLVDEGFEVGAICHAGEGLCRQAGLRSCTTDGSTQCDAIALEPRAEQCNELDDDCDGVVDERTCTREILSHCAPTLLWRTGFDGDELPLDIRTCSSLVDTTNFKCVSPTAANTFGFLEIPFMSNAVPFGYGFAVGLSCGDGLDPTLNEVFERDCRLYYGWHRRGALNGPTSAQFGACPREFSGPNETRDAWCSSSRINGSLGGLEFDRLVEQGDGFGLAIHCRQTVDDPANGRLRRLFNDELRLDLVWTKADALFLTDADEPMPACEWHPFMPELAFTCSSTQSDGVFGVIQIGRPSARNRTTADVMGIRLRQIEVEQ